MEIEYLVDFVSEAGVRTNDLLSLEYQVIENIVVQS